MKSRKLLANYLTMCGELFDKAITKTLIEIYWVSLESFNDSDVELAFKRLIATVKFFPKPAEIIEAISGPQNSVALSAWVAVSWAIEHVGGYNSIRFGQDPVIHSVIEAMGGWPDLCNISSKEMVWKQREFERLYQMLSGHQQRAKHPEYLCGLVELENGGFYDDYTSAPVLVDNVCGRPCVLEIKNEAKNCLEANM